MDLVQKITDIVSPSLEAMGYAIVQIKLMDGSRRKTLKIMAERVDRQGMSFDDCVEISRAAGALLEVEDPIATAYDLEVSSPGLDRPLTKLSDFVRFSGEEAKVETLIPIEGRKRFRGLIESVEGSVIQMRLSDSNAPADINFSNIKAARLSPALITAERQGPVLGQKKKSKNNN